jgi:hypothetical protein
MSDDRLTWVIGGEDKTAYFPQIPGVVTTKAAPLI